MALIRVGSTTGALGLGTRIWKPEGCVKTWNPEIKLAREAPGCALDAICTLTIACVGLSTHTRRTSTSLEPKPTVISPSAKLVFTPVMSIMARVPAGSTLGANVTLGAAGGAAADDPA